MGDIEHILAMVLNQNRGNVLTEALCVGISKTVASYYSQLQISTGARPNGDENALD
jgi:hypothetical protein